MKTKLIEEIEGNLYFFLILLGISSLFQFLFKEAFMYPSILPLNIPFENVLEYLGNLFFYLYYLSLILVSVIMAKRYKLMILIPVILIASQIFTLIPRYNISPLWYSFEVFISIVSISVLIESLLKSSLSAFFLLPSMILVSVGLIASISLNVFHQALFLDYVVLYFASLAGYIAYVLTWNNRRGFRNYLSIGIGLLSIIPFVLLINVVTTNRYMEILMNMILPSMLGIDLYDPHQITLLVLALGLSAMGITTSLIKGNYCAGIGYFMIVTTVFLGINGYTLIAYMVSPTVGFNLITFQDNGRSIIDTLIMGHEESNSTRHQPKPP